MMLKDNEIHRVIFTLPPIGLSAETLPGVQALPSQQRVTGDKEVDAIIWLREVVKTGQPGLIAAALEAAKKIKTPMKDLEKRYSNFLHNANPGNFFATFGAIGFGDLERLAATSIEKHQLKVEAQARFPGETIWSDTPAEQFCERALKRCKGFKDYINNDKLEVAKRFHKYADHMPHTLADCLHELTFWQDLSKLRSASGEWGDGQHEAIAREWFVEELLAVIPPRDANEAEQVLDYAAYRESIEHDQLIAIARNLIGGVNARPALLDLIAENQRLSTEEEEASAVVDMMAKLLAGVSIAVRGPEEPLKRHSYHDLPERCAALVAERDRLKFESDAVRTDAQDALAAQMHLKGAPSNG
jgi:hypothetical protein